MINPRYDSLIRRERREGITERDNLPQDRPVSNHCPIQRDRLNLSLFLVVPYTWNDTATLPTLQQLSIIRRRYTYVSKVPWIPLHPPIRTSQRFRSFFPYPRAPGNSICLHVGTSINSFTLLPFPAIVRFLQPLCPLPFLF